MKISENFQCSYETNIVLCCPITATFKRMETEKKLERCSGIMGHIIM